METSLTDRAGDEIGWGLVLCKNNTWNEENHGFKQRFKRMMKDLFLTLALSNSR
jgi:hypothetical protein